jgi:hypothetical protein
MILKTTQKAVMISLLAGMTALWAVGSSDAAFNTDIVAQTAMSSFGAMLDALAFPPASDAAKKEWVLTAPDGGASFRWRMEEDPERTFDAYLCFDAEPFVDAGLDLSKVPDDMKGILEGEGKLTIGKKLSGKPLEYDGEITPLSSLGQIIKLDRESVGYHDALDHYGVTVAGGMMFEWARDLSVNDKDIVFVLEPKMFIEAGVDPPNVKGWTYAKVPLEDERGRKYEGEKFLKPFDLR